jgi:hypothetical protein
MILRWKYVSVGIERVTKKSEMPFTIIIVVADWGWLTADPQLPFRAATPSCITGVLMILRLIPTSEAAAP